MNIIACDHQENKLLFSEERFKIEGQILLDEDALLDPWAILLHDSILVIANQKGDPLIELYDTYGNAGKKFLTIGGGPEEVLHVGNLQASVTNNNMYVYDLFQKKFLEFDLKKSILPAFSPDTIYYYSDYLYLHQKDSTALFDKLLMGKNCLIGESRDVRGRIVLMNFDGSLISFAGDYPPKMYEELSDLGNARLYASGFILSKDASRLALATYSADMIDIFNIGKPSAPELVWSYQGFLPHDLNIVQMGEYTQGVFMKESQKGYSGLAASDNFIYALFSGKQLKEKNYSYGNIIRVMNWDGSNRFELQSDMDLRRITVSPDDQKIYAIAIDEADNPMIVVFNIKEIIDNKKNFR
jgi:hypothetical protein